MPVIFDRAQCRPRFISDNALANGGYYFDVINSQDGFIPQDAISKTLYLDPLTGLLTYKTAGAVGPAPQDFLFADGTPFLFADGSQFEFSGI
jgi:hypothetical protein